MGKRMLRCGNDHRRRGGGVVQQLFPTGMPGCCPGGCCPPALAHQRHCPDSAGMPGWQQPSPTAAPTANAAARRGIAETRLRCVLAQPTVLGRFFARNAGAPNATAGGRRAGGAAFAVVLENETVGDGGDVAGQHWLGGI